MNYSPSGRKNAELKASNELTKFRKITKKLLLPIGQEPNKKYF